MSVILSARAVLRPGWQTSGARLPRHPNDRERAGAFAADIQSSFWSPIEVDDLSRDMLAQSSSSMDFQHANTSLHRSIF